MAKFGLGATTLLLYLAFSLIVRVPRAERYFEQNNDDTCICKLNCPIEEILQEVLHLEDRVKNLGQSQTEQSLMIGEKLDSLQEQPEETKASVNNQTNAVCLMHEQMAALHQNITTGQQQLLTTVQQQLTSVQQQMMTGQQQMMTELRTQQRLMSALEAKISAITSTVVTLKTRFRPEDCAEIQQAGHTPSGEYEVFVGPNFQPVQVFCDLEHQGGGWLVFQRRKDGSQDFRQNWDVYARGFGDLLGEFWLGNDFLHLITQQKHYKLRIDLEDFENGTKYAEYSTMTVAAASDKYMLRLSGYSGDAGDAMTYHSDQQFSTIDQDNDPYHRSCSSWGGGGWWYNNCHEANLNGQYLGGENTTKGGGVNWGKWRGYEYSLKTTVMKIRPANY